jgi:hypothetical protein
VALGLLAFVLALPVAASGQGYEDPEPTRREWVRQADDICEEPYRKGNRLVDEFEKLAKKERWARAGGILIRLGKIVLRVVDEVAELPRPPADAKEIRTFLEGEERGAELFKKAGRALKREKVREAARRLDRSERIVTRSQKSVKNFGLRECI